MIHGYTRRVKKILNTFLLKLHVLPFISALRVIKKIELDLGHFKSVYKWQSIDKKGRPIPWFTYPAIEYLKSLNISDARVFEYGSGSSTLFWVQRVKSVIAIEHNYQWFNLIKNKLGKNKNANIHYIKNLNEYVDSIKKYKGKFDIIVIDGLFRKKCAEAAVKKISDRGIIILDNSNINARTCHFLRQNELFQIEFSGFGPINPYIWTTSLFFTKNY